MVGVGVTCGKQSKPTPEEKEPVSHALRLWVLGQRQHLSLKNGNLGVFGEDLFKCLLGILTLRFQLPTNKGLDNLTGISFALSGSHLSSSPGRMRRQG